MSCCSMPDHVSRLLSLEFSAAAPLRVMNGNRDYMTEDVHRALVDGGT